MSIVKIGAACAALLSASAAFADYTATDLVAAGNNHSYAPSCSANGNRVAYVTYSTNLGSTTTPSVQLWAIVNGTVSSPVNCSPGLTGGVSRPYLSRDGKYVAFYACANSSTARQPYVYDIANTSLNHISVTSSTYGCDETVDPPAVSDDLGSNSYTVAFVELAPTWTGHGFRPIQIVAMNSPSSSAVPTLVSQPGGSGNANQDCSFPVISSDGTKVAFQSKATNIASYSGSVQQIFYAHLVSGVWNADELVSKYGSNAADRDAVWPSMSSNGSRIAFSTEANNWLSESDNSPDVFIRDRSGTPTTFLAYTSLASGYASIQTPNMPFLSSDGGSVSFRSDRVMDSNMNNADTYYMNGQWVTGYLLSSWIYGCDLSNGNCLCACFRQSTYKKVRWGDSACISDGGTYLSFGTSADQILSGATLGLSNVYRATK